MRLPFLILTPVSVFLGASAALANSAPVQWHLLAPVLVGALLAHISVNTLNEYFDFRSGLDLATTRTPFSGGSGALPRNPGAADAVLFVGVASLVVTLLIGGFFVAIRGWGILPIGLAGSALVATYTPWINRHPLLCLVAPGAGFGILMVVGTQYVLQGVYHPAAWLGAWVPFCLVNNLLLLNQYPDIDADAKAGRNHFPIAYGVRQSNRVYGVSVLLAALAVAGAVATGWFPVLALSALLPMSLALVAWHGAAKHGRQIAAFPHYLAANVGAAVLTPLFLGASMFLG